MNVGEVVELGAHRLMCGDAFNPEHVDTLMQGEKPDMLYCDPPYGMGLKPAWQSASSLRISKSYPVVIGDNAPFDPSSLIARFSGTQEQFWWGADYYAESIPNRNTGSWVIWDKRGKESLDRGFGSCFETCWSRKRHKRDFVRVTWFGAFGMVAAEGDDRRYHPTQKPARLAEWFLDRYSKEGATIADFFGGSGSTLLACERKNRVCRMMELSPQYCDVIIDRYQQMTQQQALPLSA